jgi:Family of unknown function (DUF5706)
MTETADQNPSSDEQQAQDVLEALSKWQPTTPNEYLPGAQWSLKTVTHLTEYEDEKANRILTAMAFLSALVGVVFAAVVQKCPMSYVSLLGARGYCFSSLALFAVYVLFPLYFLILAVGATLTVFAVRPRFRIPKTWAGTPGSLLFYAKIVSASGKEWANAFAQRSGVEVDRQYLKDAIFETYLIAQKIRIKLRKLRWGIWFFIVSTVLLVVLLPLCAVVIARIDSIPPEKTPVVQRADIEPNVKGENAPQSEVPRGATNDTGKKEGRENQK